MDIVPRQILDAHDRAAVRATLRPVMHHKRDRARERKAWIPIKRNIRTGTIVFFFVGCLIALSLWHSSRVDQAVNLYEQHLNQKIMVEQLPGRMAR